MKKRKSRLQLGWKKKLLNYLKVGTGFYLINFPSSKIKKKSSI